MDLEQFSLEQLRAIVESGDLLPSEKVLEDEIPQRFAALESMGIRNLKELTTSLSTKKKIERFSQESGLPQDYLTVIRRRAGFYTPRPKPLKGMLGVEPEYVKCLAAAGIKNTKQLFERTKTRQGRAELSRKANVPDYALLKLTKLADLSRAPFVGPVYARLFYEAGADTLEKLAKSDSEDLLARIHEVNEEKNLTKAALPLSVAEMESFLEIARMIPITIEY
jgi:hypothetical protein